MASENFDLGNDWDDDPGTAMVLLETCLRVRFTDPDMNPLTGGHCRVADDPGTVYPVDANGIAEIPLKDRSRKEYPLEWEGAETSEPFPWSNTFRKDIESAESTCCEKRLENLGFEDDEPGHRVIGFQSFFGLKVDGKLDSIKDDLVKWHDGGEHPAPLNAKVKGKTGTSSKPAAPAKPALAPDAGDPLWPRHVMIVPDDTAGTTDEVYKHNIMFADQWRRFNPEERAVVQVAANGDLENAVAEACKYAKKAKAKSGTEETRKVILFVGHGGVGDNDKKATSFDTVPEPGHFADHKFKITDYAVQLGLLIRSGEWTVADPNVDHPVFKSGGITMTDSNTGDLESRQNVRWRKWLQLNRIGRILKENHIEEFVLLSCSVGKDQAFAKNLAELLEVKVGLYSEKVATQGVEHNDLVQIWIALPGSKTPAEYVRNKPKLTFDAKKRPKADVSLHEYPTPQLRFGG